MRGRRGVAESQPISTAVHMTWHRAQINFGDVPLYITYGISHWSGNHIEKHSSNEYVTSEEVPSWKKSDKKISLSCPFNVFSWQEIRKYWQYTSPSQKSLLPRFLSSVLRFWTVQHGFPVRNEDILCRGNSYRSTHFLLYFLFSPKFRLTLTKWHTEIGYNILYKYC